MGVSLPQFSMKYYGTKKQIGGCSVYIELKHPVLLKHIKRHSPDGFQWGYGGSGPADLALSIIMDFDKREGLDGFSPDKIYQLFKRDFIMTAGDELSIDFEDIKEWLRNIPATVEKD